MSKLMPAVALRRGGSGGGIKRQRKWRGVSWRWQRIIVMARNGRRMANDSNYRIVIIWLSGRNQLSSMKYLFSNMYQSMAY